MASTVDRKIQDSQEGYLNDTYWIIHPLFLLVQNGEVDRLASSLDIQLDRYDFRGRVSKDVRKQIEYMAVSLVNTFMIAAIQGGAYPPEANMIADQALRRLLHVRTPADISPIIREAALQLCEKAREAQRADTGNIHVERARNYLATHLTQDLAAADIADYVGVSQSHLSRLFRKHTGRSMREYVVDERIAAAKQLLETTDRSIPSIASLLRFCDQSYFTCSFRERTGTTPAQYRREHRR